MSQITIQRQPGGGREQITLASEHGELRCEAGTRLALVARRVTETWVTGGAFFELAPAAGTGSATARLLRAASDGFLTGEPAPFQDAHGGGMRVRRQYSSEETGLDVASEVSWYDADGRVRLAMTLRNAGREPLRLERAFPFVAGPWWDEGGLSLAGRTGAFAAYKTGWQSWSFAGGLPPGREEPRPHLPTLVTWHHPTGRRVRAPLGGLVDVVSDGMGMVGVPGQPWALLLGFLSGERWLGQIFCQRGPGALAACVALDGAILNPGEALKLPPLVIALGPQRELPARYAAMVGSEGRARHPERALSGWCSWYYYFGQVSAEDVEENLSALATGRDVLPLQVAQIDDGYQASIGDWATSNSRFPHGIAALATHIRESGYRPGLWLAPFTVLTTSQLAREHPDWLVANARGQPAWGGRHWGQTTYALDTTHPGARAWLRRLFTTLVEEWGYDYLKLDFLASAALPGRRYDPAMPRLGALREGLALIRETVGERTFLLGCGCPLLPAVGLVDAMRIGPDVAPDWAPHGGRLPMPFGDGYAAPSLEGALRNTLTRAWMHPDLWLNDPDCVLARDRQTRLSLAEVRAFASAVALTGGMVMLSDRVTQLPMDRLELAARLLPPMCERAEPLDYFTWGIPAVVMARIERPWGRWLLVGLFNESRRAREVRLTWAELGLPPGQYHAVEFWSGAYLGASPDGVRVRVEPHGAAVLAIHAAGADPLLLATSFHVTQGAAELADWAYDAARREVRWRIRLGRHDTGTCMLWLPLGLQPRALRSTARAAHWRRDPRGVLQVAGEIRDEAEFLLELERTS
jgi:alpha-galactosidase